MLPPFSAGRYPGNQYEANMLIAASPQTFKAYMAVTRQSAHKGEPWALRVVLEIDCAKAMFAYAVKVKNGSA